MINSKKTPAILLLVLLSACGSNNNTPSESEISKSLAINLSNICQYASISEFKKTNGYEQNDIRGNPEYIVDFEYTLTLKASDDWAKSFKRKNKNIEAAQKDANEANLKIAEIYNEANQFFDERMEEIQLARQKEIEEKIKTDGVFTYQENNKEPEISLYIEAYEKYTVPANRIADSFIEKWNDEFNWNDDIEADAHQIITTRLSITSYLEPSLQNMRLETFAPKTVIPHTIPFPTSCVGDGDGRRTALELFNRRFRNLAYAIGKPTRYNFHQSTIPVSEDFITGASVQITGTRAMRKTENGWVFK